MLFVKDNDLQHDNQARQHNNFEIAECPGQPRHIGEIHSVPAWDWTCFDGVDWNDKRDRSAVYKFEGKDWNGQVDGENGNYAVIPS